MNREKFKHIARLSKTPDSNDIVDLVEINKEFPYFSWGFILLAKIYNEREDFRTETLMHQAALRVSNREWLYNFIHGIQDSSQPVVTNPIPEIPVAESNNDPSELTVTQPVVTNPISEISVAESNNTMQSTPTLEELKKALLKPEIDLTEVSTPITNAESQEIPELSSDNDELTQSSFFLPVLDEIHSENTPSNSVDKSNLTSPNTKKTKGYYNIEDYYTLPPESYNNYEFNKPKEIENPKNSGVSRSSNDFYSWLNSEIPQNAPALKPIERRDDLLEKFLKNKPHTTRNKQEFYSPEKAGKRSDTLSNSIITETLANIYYKQGNFNKAIEAYQHLQLKFPEKMSYFALLIEKIKKESIS